MSTALHIARPEHMEKLLLMMSALQRENELDLDDIQRRQALTPVLAGSPHGVVYLIGPERAPVGYVSIGFGWSMQCGGLSGIVDEIFVRPAVRGRGIATEALTRLAKALKEAGLTALHLEVGADNDRARHLFERAHFKRRDNHHLMSRAF
ncbi:MAG: GNAT family N-acetyltransferase [Rhodobacteraceae bacterium]|nr:GNAT family N-acetyltransferase [Paracoccaceae bacterium]